jgi:signal transduction histidine kinase
VRSPSRNISTVAPAAAGDQAGDGPAFGRDGAEANGGGLGRPGGQADGNGARHPEVPQAQARPASRRALKNWRVRSRLLLLITIPTLTAVALGGIRIASSVQSALAYQRVLQLTTLSSDITVLAQRLEDERDQTVYYIALGSANGRSGQPSPAKTVALGVVKSYQHETAQAAAQVRSQLQEVGGSFPAQTQQEATTALSELSSLGELRDAATFTRLPALVVVRKYTALIDDLLVLEDATGQGASDATLAQSVRVLGLVSHMKEDASEQRAILGAALIQHTLSTEAQTALTNAQSDQTANFGEFNLTGTAAQRQLFNSTGTGPNAFLAPNEETQAITLAQQSQSHSLAADATNADDWYGAMTHIINFQMGAVERSLVNQITTRGSVLRNQAVTTAIVTGAVILFVLALALFFTVVVARSMVRPLRRLRAGALEVAGMRLPETVRRMSEGEGAGAPLEVEPIEVDSTDEIGEVARAFDQVHREAVRLASNEAALRGNVNAMFVNLSRRSQSLVERQIRLIDDLEQGEQDSERLGNLFQMDHLATRMRRNSENLLVLAGHEVSRRWTQAVGLVDVLRAAVSEIEQYERVTLNVQPGISVRGQAVNDVVHLLAELVENATSFSAAETPVAVSGHLLNSGGVLLDITDQGVGMGAEEMAHANWRLDNPPVVDVAVSRRMGLFVVARLAARHGIRVRLRPASMGGLTALVWLPDEVIAHETAATPPGLRRFTPASPGAPGLLGANGPAAPGHGAPGPGAPRFTDSDSLLTGSDSLLTGGATDRAAADTGAPSEPDAGLVDAPAGPLPVRTAPVHGAPAAAAVIVPAAMSPAGESRLPIFESVESDWFRRSRQGADAPDPGELVTAWSSPADEGWRAAEVAHAPVSDGLTAAGLPQRVPQANLVPGRAGLAAAVTEPAPLRSAVQTQARLASFQRAVRDARAAAQAATTEQDGGDGQPRQADLSGLPSFQDGSSSRPEGKGRPRATVRPTRAACLPRCWRMHTGCRYRRSRCRRRTPAAGCRSGWRRKPRPGTAPRCH